MSSLGCKALYLVINVLIVTWYATGRGGEVNSPTLLCLNQQALKLTAKTVGE